MTTRAVNIICIGAIFITCTAVVWIVDREATKKDKAHKHYLEIIERYPPVGGRDWSFPTAIPGGQYAVLIDTGVRIGTSGSDCHFGSVDFATCYNKAYAHYDPAVIMKEPGEENFSCEEGRISAKIVSGAIGFRSYYGCLRMDHVYKKRMPKAAFLDFIPPETVFGIPAEDIKMEAEKAVNEVNKETLKCVQSPAVQKPLKECYDKIRVSTKELINEFGDIIKGLKLKEIP